MAENINNSKPHNAKEILREALDTIEATYWIAGTEFKFAMAETTYSSDFGTMKMDWSDYDEVTKFIAAPVGDPDIWSKRAFKEADDKPVMKVVGVCSIGALALANVTLYDEPLTPWEQISGRDIETFKAGAALAMIILAMDNWKEAASIIDNGYEHGSIIANWNDRDDTTRKEVIAHFTAALDSPILTCETPVEIITSDTWGKGKTGLTFATEAEAQTFLESETFTSIRDEIWGESSGYTFEVRPVELGFTA